MTKPSHTHTSVRASTWVAHRAGVGARGGSQLGAMLLQLASHGSHARVVLRWRPSRVLVPSPRGALGLVCCGRRGGALGCARRGRPGPLILRGRRERRRLCRRRAAACWWCRRCRSVPGCCQRCCRQIVAAPTSWARPCDRRAAVCVRRRRTLRSMSDHRSTVHQGGFRDLCNHASTFGGGVIVSAPANEATTVVWSASAGGELNAHAGTHMTAVNLHVLVWLVVSPARERRQARGQSLTQLQRFAHWRDADACPRWHDAVYTGGS